MVTRGLARIAPPNDPGAGFVFARRRVPSFVGYPSVRHGCSMVRESSDGLRSPQPQPTGRPPRLGEKAFAAMRWKRLSPRTEEAYLAWMRRFWEFHGRRAPVALGAPEVAASLESLATSRRVAASTQNQALAVILFLDREVLSLDLPWLEGVVRAKSPRGLPTVLDCIAAPVPRLMATLLYGAGLRLMECCRHRVEDIDFSRNQLIVRRGKGDRDRATMLPAALRPALEIHLANVRRQHDADFAAGASWVELPDALAAKYPNAGREWPWAWVFPATRTYLNEPTGAVRTEPSCKRPSTERLSVPASPSASRARPSGIPSPPTCSSRAPTFGRSKRSSVTTTSRRR